MGADRVETMAEWFKIEDYGSKTSLMINGDLVVFKLLERHEEPAFRKFFLELPSHEVDHLRDDVHALETIRGWIEGLDYSKVLPLVAWDEDLTQILAVASLHLSSGVYRHIADLRIVVGRNHRRLGLGSAMIKELIGLGSRLGLYFLRAEILSISRLAIKAFRQLGFEYRGTFEDGFMTRKGDVRDVVIMVKRVRQSLEEDMFYEF